MITIAVQPIEIPRIAAKVRRLSEEIMNNRKHEYTGKTLTTHASIGRTV